jgi:hypothetical protein
MVNYYQFQIKNKYLQIQNIQSQSQSLQKYFSVSFMDLDAYLNEPSID